MGCGSEDIALTGIPLGGLGGLGQRAECESTSFPVGSSGGHHMEGGAQGQGRSSGTRELATAPVQATDAGRFGWGRKGEASVWALIRGREHLSVAADGAGGGGGDSLFSDGLRISDGLIFPNIQPHHSRLPPCPPPHPTVKAAVVSGSRENSWSCREGGGAGNPGSRDPEEAEPAWAGGHISFLSLQHFPQLNLSASC